MTKIIIITDDGKSKKNNKKSKKKKAIDQDIDSPVKEENWDFGKIGRRMMQDE